MTASSLISLIAAAIAVVAAVVAVRAARSGSADRQSLAGSAQADHTGPPRSSRADHTAPPRTRTADAARTFTVRVVEGHTRRHLSDDTRDYAFVLEFTNPTQEPIRITSIVLRVTYRTRANFLGALDLPFAAAPELPPGQSTTHTLTVSTSNVIPRHCRIDAYTLLIADGEGGRTVVDASLPAMLQADTDGAGPATWGWD